MIQIAFLVVVLMKIFIQRKLSVKTCFCKHYKATIQDDLFLRFYPHYCFNIYIPQILVLTATPMKSNRYHEKYICYLSY